MAIPAGFAPMADVLRGYGLEELTDWAFQQFVAGRSMNEVLLEMENLKVVRTKFAAVFERRKAGLPPISFQDVVEYRRQAGQLESLYDLPHGFLDVNRLMIGDVSVQELSARAESASEVVRQRPDVLAQLRSWGMSEGDAVAFALDPDTGLPAVQRRFDAAKVAARASQQSSLALSRAEAEGLVGAGVDEAQAEQGFGTLGRFGEVTQQLVGEADAGMARDAQLGVVAGQQGATADLERRARGRTSVFEESGGVAANQGGVFGAGTAGR